MKLKWKFKKIIVSLVRLNNSPPEIALGVAIGVFIGILPVYGLHTVLVILAAILVRPANKIAILLGTNISLPPTVPIITWSGYDIGRFILRGNFEPLSWGFFKTLTWQKIYSHYQPLFLGSVILGALCASVAYLVTFFIVKGVKSRKQHA